MKCTSVATACTYLLLSLGVIFADQSEEFQPHLDILACFIPCSGGYTGNEVIPGTGCVYYHECWEGEVRSRKGCGSPLVFNEALDYCDFPSQVNCVNGDIVCPGSDSPTGDFTERPTRQPTPQPTRRPTKRPRKQPTRDPTTMSPVASIVIELPPAEPLPGQIKITMPPTAWPTMKPTLKPTMVQSTPIQPNQPVPEPSTVGSKPEGSASRGSAIAHIESKRNLIEKYVLLSYNNGLDYPSKIYTYGRFMQSLQTMAVDGFGADFKFNLWEGDPDKYYYGLVNLAAFLANSMVESVETDSCDELNWQEVSGRYAFSNACGQESRSYQDETCDTTDDVFSCDVIAEMEVTAISSASESRAPPPLTCKPGSGGGYHSGYWDSNSGTPIANSAYSNDLGRTDTEGCCFWGRGAIMTRGVCNIGKLNYYIGKRGADSGRSTLYPTVDFCQDPEATCASGFTEELRWTVGFFEWSERIQRYRKNGWDYEKKLIDFVDNGMVDDSFIDSVSRILSQGCHAPGCSEYEVRMLDRRRSNFYLIINDTFDVKTLQWLAKYTVDPTRQPSERPTQRPTDATKQPTPEPTPLPTRVTSKPVVVNIFPPNGSLPQQVTAPSAPSPTQFYDENSIPSESSSTDGGLDKTPPSLDNKNNGPSSNNNPDSGSTASVPSGSSSTNGGLGMAPSSLDNNNDDPSSDNTPDGNLISLEGNGAANEAILPWKLRVLIPLAAMAAAF